MVRRATKFSYLLKCLNRPMALKVRNTMAFDIASCRSYEFYC